MYKTQHAFSPMKSQMRGPWIQTQEQAQHAGCFEITFTILIEHSWNGQRLLLQMQIL